MQISQNLLPPKRIDVGSSARNWEYLTSTRGFYTSFIRLIRTILNKQLARTSFLVSNIPPNVYANQKLQLKSFFAILRRGSLMSNAVRSYQEHCNWKRCTVSFWVKIDGSVFLFLETARNILKMAVLLLRLFLHIQYIWFSPLTTYILTKLGSPFKTLQASRLKLHRL